MLDAYEFWAIRWKFIKNRHKSVMDDSKHLKAIEFLFCHILTPSGTFGVFIVTPKAFDHASVFDALGVRMGCHFAVAVEEST